MKLRFRQLQALHAVIESGTVTGAADVLGISQPGISNLLSQLESQSGLKLFERISGRLVPTPEAEMLYQEIDTVVRGLDQVGQTVLDLQNKNLGQLQIASQHSISFGFLPKLVAQFAKNRPDLKISFQSQSSAKVQEWVVAGLYEIGICETPLHHDALNVYPLHIETVVALPADSPLCAHDVLTPDLMIDQPFVVMGPDHVTYRRLREAFDSAGIPLKERVQSHLFKNLLSFVQEGMGAAIVDQFALDYNATEDFVTRPFRPKIMMEMAVITSSSRPISRVGQEFLDLLLQELKLYSNS